MKLLEIAKKNALNVHGGLTKNESVAMRAGGLTIEKLTEKCMRVAAGKEDPITEDIPDDMLNHPFEMVEKAPEQLTFRPEFEKRFPKLHKFNDEYIYSKYIFKNCFEKQNFQNRRKLKKF